MKNLIRYKNRIYRKYTTDLWGQVIMRGKLTRIFKHLLQVFNFRLKRYYFWKRFSWNRFMKKKNISTNIDSYLKGLNKMQKLNLLEVDFEEIEEKSNKDTLYNIDKNFHFLKNDLFEKRKLNNYMKNDTHLAGLYDKFNYFSELNKWKNFFLHNIGLVYFNNFKLSRKKKSIIYYLKYARRSSKTGYSNTQKIQKDVNILKKKTFWKGRKKRALYKLIDESFDHKNRLKSWTTWLDCEKKFKEKKVTWWWKLKGTIRKVSIFYGILSLKKFRYIENFVNKKNSLKTIFAIKLETMINVILYRSNLFSNVYFSNNFIRGGGIKLNNKVIIYPYKFMKKNDLLMVNKKYFKKIFNIFFKKLFFSKKMLFKNNVFKTYNYLNSTKFLLNYPSYLEINYKILHIILWKIPNKKDLKGLAYSASRSMYEWSVGTEVDYQN